MSKRLSLSLIPLLATAIFAVMPAASQAATPFVTSVTCVGGCNPTEAGTIAEGPEAGAQKIKIVGGNFEVGKMIMPPTFAFPGGLETTAVTTLSATEMEATTKAQAAGPYSVVVTNGETGKSNAAQALEGHGAIPKFVDGPQVLTLSVTKTSVGTKFKEKITGTGFQKTAGATTMTVSNANAKVTAASTTASSELAAEAEITCEKAGPDEVNVTTTKGATGKSKSGRDVICENAASIPHYYVNSTSSAGRENASGGHHATVSWGTLSLTNVKGGSGGKVTCHNVIGAWIENPSTEAAGPAGVSETQSFNPYECESAACTSAATETGPATYISVLAEPTPFTSPTEPGGNAQNLGWKSVLIYEESTKLIRGETIYAKVNVICHLEVGANPETGQPIFANAEEVSEGANRPSSGPVRRTPSSPPFLEFDATGAGSGELHGPGSEAGRTGKTEGILSTLGYNEEEIVNTKLN